MKRNILHLLRVGASDNELAVATTADDEKGAEHLLFGELVRIELHLRGPGLATPEDVVDQGEVPAVGDVEGGGSTVDVLDERGDLKSDSHYAIPFSAFSVCADMRVTD